MDPITTLFLVFVTGLSLIIFLRNQYLLQPRLLVSDFKSYLLNKENYTLLSNNKRCRIPKNDREIDTANGEYSNPIYLDLVIQHDLNLEDLNACVLGYLATRGHYFRCLSVAESYTELNPSISTTRIALCNGCVPKDYYRITIYLLHEKIIRHIFGEDHCSTVARICVAYKRN